MRLATLVLVLCGLCAAPGLAQTPGTCETGSAELDLAISDVLARLFNTGSLFFGNTTVSGDGYLVPKNEGTSPVFAAGIWIGGLIGGDVRVAAATYNDFEFWPGPLDEDGSLPNPDDCSTFDRFWLVDPFDLALYDATGEATGDLLNWPVDLGAPVIDGDGVEGNYNLAGGDRPEVYGHQTAFWVMNDVGNEHRNSLTEPIGLEVRVTAFTSLEAGLDQHTFYRYEVVNRNSQPFEAARFGLFMDSDLGDPADDYVGSDSTRSMAFVYNADNDDNGGLSGGYGDSPPAFGYDFLSGGEVSMFFISAPGTPNSDPNNGEEIYFSMNARWRDGVPLTEGGDGYGGGGPVLTWAYPGDPVTEAFWSELNINSEGNSNPPGDRRHTIASPAFTLAPGESRTFDFALLFAQGEDNLDSVAELQAISDAVQARYDAGDLFAPSPLEPAPPGTLATPELLAPEDGAFIVGNANLQWTEVPGAEYYRVDFATEPDFSDRTTWYGNGSGQAGATTPTPNEVVTYYWRVQAVAGLEQSFPSEARSYTIYQFAPEYFGEAGQRIVETAHPAVTDVCADAPDDPGCADERAPGNTVWRDPNSTSDYVLTTPDNDLADLLRDVEVVDDDDFEIRFTEACATPGACLGTYWFPLADANLITSVPFELWNVRRGLRESDDAADDVRMIPLLRALTGTEPVAEWADTFPAEQDVIAGEDTLMLPVTNRVLGLMPDRPNGYALFEAAANGFGGPGATYDPATDGDEQIDPNPADGSDCRSQNFYADFCYRGNSNRIVAPVGGLEGIVLADLAGDGTTPPPGTTIRFVSNDRLFVDAEGDAPAAPQAFRLGSAFPNPFAATATVPFEVERAGSVRLSVFDVLGRRVATLVDGDVAAGPHRATLDGSRLATGVYFVVLDADGQRQATKVLLVR
ncbi:MAG: T9SS type A sorting domain-containing protein [Rhodothermales bacterium]